MSGWIGGLKETKARDMMAARSDYAVELAVKGMLPKNTLGKNALTRLHLYKGAEHPHAAQKPDVWPLDAVAAPGEGARAGSSFLTAPAVVSPPLPVFAFTRTAPVPSSSTAVTSTSISVWTP